MIAQEPCQEVRRACRFVMDHQTNVEVKQDKIDELIEEMDATVA